MDAEITEFVRGSIRNTFTLKGQKLIMGTSSTADLVTSAISLSDSEHATLELINGKWHISDNFSVKGVFVDGMKVELLESVPLESGCEITMGSPDSTNVKYEFHCKSRKGKMASTKNKKKKNEVAKPDVPKHVVEQSSPISSENEESPMLPLRERIALRLAKSTACDAANENAGPSTDRQQTPKRKKPSSTKTLSLSKLCEFDEETKSLIVAIPQKRLLELEKCERKCAQHEKQLKQQKLKIKELIEKELCCPICFDLYTKAVTLSCGHSFCEKCFTSWSVQSIFCPVCRGYFRGSHKTLAIDDVISVLKTMSEDCDKENKPKKRVTKAKKKQGKPEVIQL